MILNNINLVNFKLQHILICTTTYRPLPTTLSIRCEEHVDFKPVRYWTRFTATNLPVHNKASDRGAPFLRTQ